MTIDFDKEVDRSVSHSLKYDVREAYFGRSDVIPMWVADMDLPAPEAVTEALTARAQHPIFGYTVYPDSLYDSLINWCELHYQWTVSKSDVIMCPGVVPALRAIIEAITKPGDKVIAQPPVYFPFFSVVTKAERELILNPLKLVNNRYYLDFEHLEQSAKDGAKVLLFCSPHNPVGRVWQRAELEQLISIAQRYQMTIISDEIHADLIDPNQQHISLATLAITKHQVITAIAPSKTFNIPGLGLSSLIVPDKKQRLAITEVFENWHLNASNPFSVTAFEAAYKYGGPWLSELRQYIYENKYFVKAFLEKHCPDITVVESEGTYLLWLDCRQLQMENADLRKFFIDEAGVGMNPGYVFGEVGSGFMRMNIGTRRALIEKALLQIKQALDSRKR
ncbi:hypothetical protein LCGC14_1005450 [marine sediment metagenome]|uniref:cysteine-S-conjugate beta-lyase n=1 Tax=marine sediment metagenome TaxID=412755 RepID=A0A0F9QK31_9ZZZZ